MIKAIYFDLDNTLVDRAASIEQFSRTFVSYYADNLVNVSWRHVASLIKQVDNGGYLAQDSKYKKIYEAVGWELYSNLSWVKEISAREITRYWRDEFPRCTVEMKGASELVHWLIENEYYVGVISNGATLSRENTLNSTSFRGFVSQLVSSEAFGVKKPHPEIFIETANKAGFLPRECVYVGDHPLNDVQGALNAGMHSVLLTGYHLALPVAENCIKIKCLSGLPRVLEHSLTNRSNGCI